MKVVEDAFVYRLVWALEAIRTRRVSLGWSADIISGGGAAALETGVPRLMMSMLIRAGLPSRRAAMAAVTNANSIFTTPAEMSLWLESNEIAAFTDLGDWPTPETAALWKRFRTQALGGGEQKWSATSFKRLLDMPAGAAAPSKGFYRILPNADDAGRTWLSTPDFKLVARFKKATTDPKPSLFWGKADGESKVIDVMRVGRGTARWPRAKHP